MRDEAKTKRELIEELDRLRRQAAAAEPSRHDEEIIRAVLTNDTPMIVSTVAEGRCLAVSEAFLRLLGLTRNEVVGKTTIEIGFLTPGQRAFLIDELAGKGRIDRFELQVAVRGGEVKTGYLNVSLIRLGGEDHFFTVVTDITAQKREEEGSRKSRYLMSELIEHSGALICVKDREGRYELVNRRWEDVTGLKRLDVLGKTDEELFPGEAGRQFRRNDLTVMERQSALSLEETLPDPNGTRFFISLKFPLREGDGSVTGICAMITDITDRKRTEERLRESEALYRTFINASPDMVFLKDDQLRNIVVSRSLAAFFGRPENDVVGKTDFELMPEAAAQSCHQTDLTAMERTGVVTSEETVGDRVYETHKFRVELGEGRTGVGGFIQDITVRKRAEEAIRKLEREKSAILDAMSEIVIFVDSDLKVLWSNTAANKLFNLTAGQMEGEYCYRKLHGLSRPCRICPAAAAVKTGNPCTVEDFASMGRHWTMRSYPVRDDAGNLAGIVEIVTDITERKQAEEALRESEARYRAIFENASIGVAQANPETGHWIRVNRKLCEITGYSEREMLKIRFSDITHPEDRDKDWAAFQRVIRGEQPDYRLEKRYIRKDGGIAWVNVNVTVIRDAAGLVISTVAVIEDISERRAAQEALMKSEELSSRLIATIPDLVVRTDISGEVRFVNDMVVRAGGYERSELVGKHMLAFIAPEDHERAILNTFRILEENIGTQEYHLLVKNGEKRLFEVNSDILRTPGGDPYGIVNVLRDITDRKRAEEALLETRRQLADIIEFLPDATLVIDREGRVIAWNRAIEVMTGVAKTDMIGRGNHEYALPFYGQRRPILVDLAMHPDQAMESEYTTIQRVGDILFGEAFTPALPPGDVHLSATASVLRDSRGEIVAAIECIRDNTERKRMEERLNRAEKMEGLGRLAGGVAHDLNNVLGVLVGYSEMLMEKLPDTPPLMRYAENIYQSGLRGAAIIQDLLTLARRGVAAMEVVDINRIVADYFRTPELEKLKVDRPGIRIRMETADGLLNIKGSPVHLVKTLANLVVNAVESIADQGDVVIRTENCYLDRPLTGYDAMQEGDYVLLTVSDTGGGISAADLGKIFEPFYTKKVMGMSGTGLGLSIVWGVVKDHNGYIDVQSREGLGTVFSVYFPVTREAATADQRAVSVESYLGRGETILVVDDMEAQRDLATSMLERLGYRVAAAASGEEAVDLLRRADADLIVLDMIMDDGMDGLDTYKAILAFRPGQKAVVVSGFAETDRVRQVLRLGAGAFVRKPYIMEKIGLAVRRELDRQ
ncbi:MAG: Blue-light-activated protein [Syntrophaceae bacterium PtaU1.Bin231]|nr:MAG: Blue-light-activated protein [Syntrophaceae bacterium PtaU1.Bin231]